LACRVVNGVYQAERDGYSCDAVKAKLARDTKRWSDLLSMRGYLLEYLNKTGGVPRLNVGTYVTGSTTSTWPSWQEYLYPALGGALATDPLNQHARCASGTDQYDAMTCWNKDTQKYLCPTGSHIYQYQSLGGKDFILRSDFETSATSSWQGQNCLELPYDGCTSNRDCVVNDAGQCVYEVGNIEIGHLNQKPDICRGTVVGVGGVCGDGVLGGDEECEINQSEIEPCCAAAGSDGANFDYGACASGSSRRTGTVTLSCSGCRWTAGKKCQVGACGDGKVQAPESCDDGSLNGKYGYCNATCSGVSARCGDGKVQPGEACDCGVKNGQYSFNAVMSSLLETGNGNTCTPSSYASVASCSWDCQSAAPRCGDGIVNGQEACDGGYQEFKGYCADAAQTGCNSNQDCPAGLACQTGLAVCPQPEQTVHRNCLGNMASGTGDDNSACTWGSWQCSEPGTCGDGKVQSGEECDDGNAKMGSDTPCLKTGSILCRRNRCGDGYVNRAGGEECDNGAFNGSATPAPDYGAIQNYCTTSCKLSTVTGGFCGDNILQGASATPPGPEKCERTAGTSDYVCISIDANQLCKAGGITSAAGACSAKCEPGCADPNARPCKNVPVKDAAGQITNDHDRDGLMDECDPDDDNDAVPDSADCQPKNSAVHPAYHPGGTSSCDVAAAQEVCDGVDNDCDGRTDNIIKIEGKVINAKKKDEGLDGAVLQVFCADNDDQRQIGDNVVSQNGGNFSITAVVPGGCDNVSFGAGSSGNVCVDGTDKKVFPVSYCQTMAMTGENAIIGVPRPGSALNPGAMATAYIEWGTTPPDLDFYVKARQGSTVRSLGYHYGFATMADIGWDRDATGGLGPETMTVKGWVAGNTYDFFVDHYTGCSSKNSCSGTSPDWGQSKEVVFRMFNASCGLSRVNLTGVSGDRAQYWNVGTFNADTLNFSPINAYSSTEPSP
jgi:hypothetical protein